MNKLDLNNLPKHIAIILDGNGRWAKKRLLPRNLGHRKGAFNIRSIASYLNKLGINVLSLYCFSTENWKRPKEEVNYLMTKPVRFLKRYLNDIKKSNIKIIFSGRKNKIPSELLKIMNEIIDLTKDHTGLILNICFDYGSKDEIVRGIKNIIKDYESNKINIDDINETMFNKYLDTKDLPDVDLLIRTSGEKRVSNFLLYQIAYAEFYFTDVLWPDFDENEMDKALLAYQNRDRKYGALKE